MKNKALIYVLIPVVGFIWYKVFFRIKSNVSGDEITVLQPNRSEKEFHPVERDTFDMILDYRDPFGDVKRKSNVQQATLDPRQTPIVNRQPKSVMQWPSIIYKGRVKQTSQKGQHALIVIDGYLHRMRLGESVYDGIVVKGIGRDSLVIRYKKKTKVFWKEN
jgi:hypothetical protein